MTTYTTITNALVAVGAKPFATTIQALRDNPLAIAEQDPSVPDALKLGHWFLGSLTMTSGTSQTLSGLVLTPYRFLVVSVNAVSTNASSSTLLLNGAAFAVLTAGAVAQTGSGGGFVELASGVYWSSSGNTSGAAAPSFGGASGLSNASTSITFTSTGGGTFDAGSIRIYGIK